MGRGGSLRDRLIVVWRSSGHLNLMGIESGGRLSEKESGEGGKFL